MLLAFYGSSGVGKTSLIKQLHAQGLAWVRSSTTRPRRLHEQEDYHFIDQEKWDGGSWCLSTSHQNHSYGVDRNVLQQALLSSAWHVMAVDFLGAEELQGHPNARLVLVVLSDEKERRRRLAVRGEPEGSPRYLDEQVMQAHLKPDYVLINDASLEMSVARIWQWMSNL